MYNFQARQCIVRCLPPQQINCPEQAIARFRRRSLGDEVGINHLSSSSSPGSSLMPCTSALSSSSMRLRRGSRTPCSSRARRRGTKGSVRPRVISLVSSSSTNWSTQVSSQRPRLFLSLSLRLSTQKGSRSQWRRGGLRVRRRQRRARALRYLYSFSPRQTSTMSSERPICSILKSRQRNLVGFLAPPYSPPMHFSSTALSMKLSAFSAKHSSFQYRELKIRFRVVLSITCVAFLASLIQLSIIKAPRPAGLASPYYIMQPAAIKPLRLSASLILSLGDAGQDSDRYLMLVRKPHMSFENSLVFPGGACDKEDEAFSSSFSEFAKITAVRELLEETGILLLPPGAEVHDLFGLREQYGSRKLSHLNSLLLSLWQKHLSLLLPVARFVTPQFPKMSRFDCLFFLALPGVQRVNLGASDSLMELSIHFEESSKYYWATPQDYLQMLADGLIFLPPPQRLLLHYLASVRREAYSIRPAVEPLLGQFGKGRYFVLPGDEDYDYEKLAEIEPKSRLSEELRLYIRQKKENCQKDHLCRVGNIFPAKQKGSVQALQILLNPQQQGSILSYIQSPCVLAGKL